MACTRFPARLTPVFDPFESVTRISALASTEKLSWLRSGSAVDAVAGAAPELLVSAARSFTTPLNMKSVLPLLLKYPLVSKVHGAGQGSFLPPDCGSAIRYW